MKQVRVTNKRIEKGMKYRCVIRSEFFFALLVWNTNHRNIGIRQFTLNKILCPSYLDQLCHDTRHHRVHYKVYPILLYFSDVMTDNPSPSEVQYT